MSVYSPEFHAMVSSPGRAGSVAATAGQPSEPDESFFHHILDVINPLQHLPVIGSIYRAITGEHIGPVEKIAGDALYGGLWGAVASIADVAFEAITGKSVEDTTLAWIKDQNKPTVVANKVTAPILAMNGSLPSSDLPALPASPAVIARVQPDGLDVAALTGALSVKGVDNEIANRALYAYRRSMAMTLQQPILASAVGQKSL